MQIGGKLVSVTRTTIYVWRKYTYLYVAIMEGKIDALREKISRFIAYCEDILKMPEPNLSKGYLTAKKQMVADMWNKIEAANDEIAQYEGEKPKAKADIWKRIMMRHSVCSTRSP